MSRPLKGSKKQTATGWHASLPAHRGAKARQSYTFRTEYAADRWLAAGCTAITAGEPLPEPVDGDLVANTGTRRVEGTSFETVGAPWLAEYYAELHRGDLDRETAARGHVRRIAAFMDERGLTMETMVRKHVKTLQASVTRTQAAAPVISVPEGLDPEGVVTMKEALELPGAASLSTLKRRVKDGTLVAVEKPRTGHRYRIGDLYAEEVFGDGQLRRGPRNRDSLSQNVANDVMWVFEQVCLYARDHGIAVPQDRDSLKMHRTDKEQSPERQPVALTQCADIAGRLHVVHQLALWLMRILGLRIGEAFGIRVGDILDQGPELPGAVTLREQGGRTYRTRGANGEVITSASNKKLKNKNSRRVLVVPPMLMEIIRVVIAVFHTDADGNVRTEARLVPGLERRDAGGQGAFRTALALAAGQAQVDCTEEEKQLDEVFSCQPHDMRRTVLSDLDRFGEIPGTHIQRFAGHVPGSAVLHRHYLLDDPKMRPAMEIAELLEGELRTELLNGLCVPTLVRCTTGRQRSLAVEATRIDVELAERGWLIVLTDDDGDPLLGSAEVAAELGVTPKTARQWMAAGLVPSISVTDRGRGTERRSRLSDVTKVRDRLAARVTLKDVAAEVEQPYHTVYQYVRAQRLELEAWGERDYLVPAATASHLRDHYARQAALHRRAVPLSVAAAMLGATVPGVQRLVEDGVLTADDRAHDGRRMVTRESIAAAQSARARGDAGNPRRRGEDLFTWDEAGTLSGLSSGELDALVADGTLVREEYQRRRHITRKSLLLFLVEHAPERLVAVAAS